MPKRSTYKHSPTSLEDAVDRNKEKLSRARKSGMGVSVSWSDLKVMLAACQQLILANQDHRERSSRG